MGTVFCIQNTTAVRYTAMRFLRPALIAILILANGIIWQAVFAAERGVLHCRVS